MAYVAAAYRFADWCEDRGLTLSTVRPLHIVGYIEPVTQTYAAATVRQNLVALRQLFDWLVLGQVIPSNPAAAIRGPKHGGNMGKTPGLTAAETWSLFDSIDTTTVLGLRDRALIGVMVYSFAQVSAALAPRVADYYIQGHRSYFRLHEKGGKYLVVPAHPRRSCTRMSMWPGPAWLPVPQAPWFGRPGRAAHGPRSSPGRWPARMPPR